MSVDLCNIFQALATRVWYRMYRSEATRIWLREDGITALNLQDLSDAAPSELVVVDFSPYRESRVTGADWEWWFVDDAGAWGAAVQAKCVKDGAYDFGYTPRGSKTRQVDRLIQYCASFGDLHPLYCLYNYWSASIPATERWTCPTISPFDGLWGCAIADGFNIQAIASKTPSSLATVYTMLQPWHCLVCCPGASTAGIGHRARFVASRAASLVGRAATNRGEQIRGIVPVLPSLPDRIIQLLEARVTDAEPQRGLVLDLWLDDPPAGVVVVGPWLRGSRT
jgi:hypothetical protein